MSALHVDGDGPCAADRRSLALSGVQARLRRPLPVGFAAGAAPGAPVVSIITVVRNGATTIGDTLASVAAQTYSSIEHIVVDGASSDDTCRIVRGAPHRPRLVSGADHGIYDAFNKGLGLARGHWITFLNADDRYAHPRAVETVMAHAARAPEVSVLHGDLELIDAVGRPICEERFDPSAPWSFDLQMPIAHPTVFVARDVYAAFGGFDATYAIAADYELLLRLHLGGVELRHVPEVLVSMRVGGLSQTQVRLGSWERKRAWLRCTGRPPLRLLLRELKVELDRVTPTLSRVLGAAKRAITGPRASMRCVVPPRALPPPP